MSMNCCTLEDADEARKAAYRRDALRPYLGRVIPMVGRFYRAEHGGFDGPHAPYKAGWCRFTDVYLFARDPSQRVFLTDHLNLCFEHLTASRVFPRNLRRKRLYILAGRIQAYPRTPERLGVQIVNLPNGLLPVCELGAYNDCYARLLSA